jgi:hypothetical protein
MSCRFIPLFLAVAVIAASLVWADEPPPDQDEPPVRLKKKPKPGEEPAKPEPAKPAEDEDKEKMKEPKDEPQPDQPAEDEKEVLQRVGKNMRSVEERLGNKELTEGTRQVQEDIIKDLDSLIRMSQNQQNQGGGSSADSSSSPEGGQKQSGSQSQSKQQSRQNGKKNGSQTAKRGQKSNGGQQSGDSDPTKDQSASNAGGNQGGAGGKDNPGPDRNADLYKDIWGHLSPALRAEMNAYSNPQAFMSKYDEMIKKYYITIAEKGRQKGD